MPIIIDKPTQIALYGRHESHIVNSMVSYGTHIVGSVIVQYPGISYFPSLQALCRHAHVHCVSISVDPDVCADALIEAIEAQIPFIICHTRNVPCHDMRDVYRLLSTSNSTLLGPGVQGILSPTRAKLGHIHSLAYIQGSIGIISTCSATMDIVAYELNKRHLGISTAIACTKKDFATCISLFEADRHTTHILLIGSEQDHATACSCKPLIRLSFDADICTQYSYNTLPVLINACTSLFS